MIASQDAAQIAVKLGLRVNMVWFGRQLKYLIVLLNP